MENVKNMASSLLNSVLKLILIKRDCFEVLIDPETGLFFERSSVTQDEDGDLNHHPVYSEFNDKAMLFSMKDKIDGKTPAQVINKYFCGDFVVRRVTRFKRCTPVCFQNNGFGDYVETNPSLKSST